MSKNLFPADSWLDGDVQPDVVVNDNARRMEVAVNQAVDFADEEPDSPAEGSLYVLSAAWGAGVENDIAYFRDGAWTFWTPPVGMRKDIGAQTYKFDGSEWAVYVVGAPAWGGIGGTLGDQTDLAAALASKSERGYTISTHAGAYTMTPSDAGFDVLHLCAGDVTFDDAEAYTEGMVFNIVATGDIDLAVDGVTLTPPFGGTLAMAENMNARVVMTGATTGRVIGQTVAEGS